MRWKDIETLKYPDGISLANHIENYAKENVFKYDNEEEEYTDVSKKIKDKIDYLEYYHQNDKKTSEILYDLCIDYYENQKLLIIEKRGN